MRVECSYVSVGAEMEADGDQAEAASSQFCCKSKEEPSRKPCDHQHGVVQLVRSDKGH